MLKKLQNLLFEDEDDDYIDDEEEEETEEPVKKNKKTEQVKPEPVHEEPAPAPVHKAEPAAVEAAAPKAEEPHINRIDVTTEIPAQKQAAPQVNFPEPPAKKEEKKSAFNITVDDPYKKTTEHKTVKPAKPAGHARKDKKDKAPETNGYTFQPVISPIFGVDEKDMNALKTTTQKVASIQQEEEEDDSNITPVLSPIYGSTASLRTVTPEEERTGIVKEEAPAAEPANPTVKTPEEELNDFSLDDILKVRDQEYSDSLNKEDDLFPDLDFDDETKPEDTVKPEDEVDQTMVIDKKSLKK